MNTLFVALKRGFLASTIVGALAAGGTPAPARAMTAQEGTEGRLSAETLSAVTTVTGSYLAGRHAQQADDWAAAAEFMARALADDPENLALLRRTYLLQLGDGRIGDAAGLARRLTAAEPGNHLAATLLAADDVIAGRFAEAQARLAGGTDDALARYVEPIMLAWIAVGRGDLPAAWAALEPMSKAQGFAVLHNFHAGLIAEHTGDAVAAESWFLKAIGAGAPLRIVQTVGGFFERAGRPEEARALYGKFIADNPGTLLLQADLDRLARGEKPAPTVSDPRQGIAEALFDIASALNQEGAGELALMYGRIAVHLRADLPLARLMIGDILAQRTRHEAALAEYAAVGGGDGLRWTARLRSAGLLEKLGRTDEAVALLDAMAAERPDRADALIELGDVQRGAERFDQAIAAYDAALSRLGEPQARHWLLYYTRAISYDKTKRWTEAERDLQRALELSPDQPLLLNYLGYSWIDRGMNLDRGRSMIERAVQLKPSDGYIIDSLGWALYRLGDFGGAVTHLERAVELKPLDPTINDHLGDAYWQVGRRAEARFQWRRALQNAEEAELARAIQGKLDNGLPRHQTAADLNAPAPQSPAPQGSAQGQPAAR
ncbi:tetratricopeptide repeat protein [Skermanella pratensis]|uniref:tetratricopeptide repeat protein n=1 Tax=Skermanella pratensis TaxID=2233999 RepID=UPI001300FA46|nr:tetratricopeptide repeat protein [Skermanella pratensis]